jgi:hypothetical protein
LIERAADLERPRVERRGRRRSDRQDGELLDDVLARWDARTVDLRATAWSPREIGDMEIVFQAVSAGRGGGMRIAARSTAPGL